MSHLRLDRLPYRVTLLAGIFAAPLVFSMAAISPGPAEAQAKTKTIAVTINRVTALDFVDWGLAGDADFYAKVTIAGETFTTQRIRGRNDIQPNWKISKSVPAGRHVIKVAIYDRDVLKPDEFVDVNRLDKKRDLDFTVDTRSCRVSGFSDAYRCGQLIKRAGKERKRAELSFTVSVE
jgi:hypothetical protein